MIDFRYHLVSLVAVFIALAVGIVLGAGPLREGISETLDEEVAQLRTERTELRTELEAADARADAKDETVELLGARGVSGTLSGSRIGVVVLPGADRDHVALAQDRVEEAGGAVVLEADLDAAWEVEPGSGDEASAFLDELAAGLVVPEVDGELTLGGILAATLAGADQEGQLGSWLAAGERLQEEGLLDLTFFEGGGQVTDRRPPEALLVVGGGLSVLAEEPEDAEARAALERRLDLVAALVELDMPLVVATAGTEEGAASPGGGLDPLVQAVRESSSLRADASTVDDLEGAGGQVAAALALAWEMQEEAGQYGLGEGAEAPVPAAPPLRVANDPTPGDAPITDPVPVEPPIDESGDDLDEDANAVDPGEGSMDGAAAGAVDDPAASTAP